MKLIDASLMLNMRLQVSIVPVGVLLLAREAIIAIDISIGEDFATLTICSGRWVCDDIQTIDRDFLRRWNVLDWWDDFDLRDFLLLLLFTLS